LAATSVTTALAYCNARAVISSFVILGFFICPMKVCNHFMALRRWSFHRSHNGGLHHPISLGLPFFGVRAGTLRLYLLLLSKTALGMTFLLMVMYLFECGKPPFEYRTWI
jgi:hypothetical protein